MEIINKVKEIYHLKEDDATKYYYGGDFDTNFNNTEEKKFLVSVKLITQRERKAYQISG